MASAFPPSPNALVKATAGIRRWQTAGAGTEKAVAACLARHFSGDWGDCDRHDAALNDRAVATGGDRVFSVYRLPADLVASHPPPNEAFRNDGIARIWVITDDADDPMSVTTVLFPGEY